MKRRALRKSIVWPFGRLGSVRCLDFGWLLINEMMVNECTSGELVKNLVLD